MKKLFGTDGMRGKAGVFPLDAATVQTTGASLATHLAERGGQTPVIVVGRDTRESGEWLEDALVTGVRGAGGICYSAGVITTPGVAFLTRSISARAGVVISASHNEYEDNGIKIFSPSGQKIDEQTETLIESDILAQRFPLNPIISSRNSVGFTPEELQQKYFDFLVSDIGSGLSLSQLTLVVDCANGSASVLAPKLFDRLGARTQAINCSPNGTNINHECGSLHMKGLQAAVKASRAAVGIAFDGDADRALFVDENGILIDGDATLWVLSNYMQSRGELTNATVVATVMSNIGLELALRREGIELRRTDVGDKYVLDELLRSGAALGGEQSGHIIFPRVSHAGDGMITALSLLRAMNQQEQSLSQLAHGMERYPQILVNVKVREKVPFGELPNLPPLVSSVEERLKGRGRLLLRYSGTEFLARIMIEGPDEIEIKNLAQEIAQVIENCIGARK
jgi:phosphoglucosamine mutase